MKGTAHIHTFNRCCLTHTHNWNACFYHRKMDYLNRRPCLKSIYLSKLENKPTVNLRKPSMVRPLEEAPKTEWREVKWLLSFPILTSRQGDILSSSSSSVTQNSCCMIYSVGFPGKRNSHANRVKMCCREKMYQQNGLQHEWDFPEIITRCDKVWTPMTKHQHAEGGECSRRNREG